MIPSRLSIAFDLYYTPALAFLSLRTLILAAILIIALIAVNRWYTHHRDDDDDAGHEW